MNKQNKKIIKHVRAFFQSRYSEIFELLMNENLSENTKTDIFLFLEYAPNFFETVKQIKMQLNIQEAEAEFQEKVNTSETAQEHMLLYLEEQIALFNEELSRTINKQCTSKAEIDKKERKINKLRKKLENLTLCKEKINAFIEELQPEKRPRGRPKKNKTREPTEE